MIKNLNIFLEIKEKLIDFIISINKLNSFDLYHGFNDFKNEKKTSINFSYFDIIFNVNETIYNLLMVLVIIYALIWFLLSQANNLNTSFFSNSTFDAEKYSPYECGFAPFKTEWAQFDIKFYLIALLFLVFDVELMFILPYCVSYNYLGVSGYIIFLIFFIILLLGFLVEWASGMLIWKGDKVNEAYKKSIINNNILNINDKNSSTDLLNKDVSFYIDLMASSYTLIKYNNNNKSTLANFFTMKFPFEGEIFSQKLRGDRFQCPEDFNEDFNSITKK